MGSVWKRLGSNVTVIEFLDHIASGIDKDMSSEFLKILKKQEINFILNSKVIRVNVIKDKAVVNYMSNETNARKKN